MTDDRLEITSYGGLPDGLSQDEFFRGFSIPRNKELMRVFRDLDLVERLGSGIPRILKYYPRSVFHFSENFLRAVLPSAEQTYRLTEQDIEQVNQLVALLEGQMLSTTEIMNRLELKLTPTVVYCYIKPAIDLGLVEMTIPEKPNIRNQRYRLTGRSKKKLL